MDRSIYQRAVSFACKSVIAAEPQITKDDTIVGDGDCGITLTRGANAILKFLASSKSTTDAASSILGLATVIENNMDGTSGAIYSLFFTAFGSALRETQASFKGSLLGTREWAAAAANALAHLQQATPARQGDRTLMDALEPFVHSFEAGETLAKALSKAKEGAEATKGMKAAFGRAVYVNESGWDLVADPGAEGVVSILEGLVKAL